MRVCTRPCACSARISHSSSMRNASSSTRNATIGMWFAPGRALVSAPPAFALPIFLKKKYHRSAPIRATAETLPMMMAAISPSLLLGGDAGDGADGGELIASGDRTFYSQNGARRGYHHADRPFCTSSVRKGPPSARAAARSDGESGGTRARAACSEARRARTAFATLEISNRRTLGSEGTGVALLSGARSVCRH